MLGTSWARHGRRAVLAAVLVVTALAGTPATAATAPVPPSWAMVRHDPQGTAYDAAETTITNRNVGTLRQAWSAPFQTMELAVGGGRVFSECSPGVSAGGICAMSQATGKVLWRSSSGTYRGIAATNGLLFLNGLTMTAIHTADGSLAWSRALTSGASRVSQPPVVAGGRVFYRDDAGWVWALDAWTGAVRWRAQVGTSYGNLVVAGTTLFVQGDPYYLEARSVTDGHVLWRSRPGTQGNEYIDLVVADGLVLLTEHYSGSAFVEAYPASGCSGGVDCEPVWYRNLSDPTMGEPAVANGVVYLSAYPYLAAYRLRDGAPLWRASTAHPVWSPPTVSGDVVYVSTYDGYAEAYRRDGCGQATCSASWSTKVADSQLPLPPVVADGHLFISGNDYAGAYTRAYVPGAA